MKAFKPVKPEIEKAVEGEVNTELAVNVNLEFLARLRERFETTMRRVQAVFGSVERKLKDDEE